MLLQQLVLAKYSLTGFKGHATFDDLKRGAECWMKGGVLSEKMVGVYYGLFDDWEVLILIKIGNI